MSNKTSNVNNIYKLDGRVPLGKAVPFGLQHILAMFVSNLTPITLGTCLIWNCVMKGYLKQLSVLIGLLVGYVVAIFMDKVDLSIIFADGLIAFPKFMPYVPEFNTGAIFSVCIIYLVSAAETIGDTSAMVATGLNREITEKEISGSLVCDGYASSISSLFGCPPVTSFSQNVGLIAMTKVVNRFTIMTGAVCMIIAKSGFNQRNITIAALSLSIGIGFTTSSEIGLWHVFPEIIQSVFSANVVAVVFVTSIILNLVLPQNMEIEKINEN